MAQENFAGSRNRAIFEEALPLKQEAKQDDITNRNDQRICQIGAHMQKSIYLTHLQGGMTGIVIPRLLLSIR